MHRFEVWAPQRRTVEAVVDGRHLGMARGDGGWWHASDPTAGPGARYGFSLDGGAVRPDPRSASQPGGVLGLSEVVDHAAFEWNDSAWRGRELAGLVLYELHIGTFSPQGTFEAAIERLPHIVRLGVDAVEVMPVAEFSGDRGWGYDGVDLFAPHHAYGGPAGFKRLVDACHDAGLAVVLDVVYNHLGPAGNFLPEFGPYFSARHQTAWGAALNFDGEGSEEVRRMVVDNATMWIRDYHVDGLRLDAVHAIVDDSPRHILGEIAAAAHGAGAEAGRRTFVIAESELNDPRLVKPSAGGGLGLDAAWADDWHHAVHTTLTGERAGYYADFGTLPQLEKALRQAWVYDGVWSPHRGRVRGGPTTGLPPDAFVVAVQNHDQVGNRAAGERLPALAGEDRVKLAAALLLTTQFTPMLFQGEEWAASTPFLYFTGHPDPDLGRAVSEGRRREFEAFGWAADSVPDPQDPHSFESSKLRWEEVPHPFHQRMLEWYTELIALRRRLPPPRGGVDVSIESGGHLFFSRPGLHLRANLAGADWTFDLERGQRLVMASAAVQPSDRRVRLAPWGVAIIETVPALV